MAKFTASITMVTNGKAHTIKTDDTPVRLMAPKGAESALGLKPNAQYAVGLYPVPAGFRMVTTDEMDKFAKPNDVVRFWSTKSNHDGDWKKVKDKEDKTWHDGALYIVPADFKFFTCEIVCNGEVVVDEITEAEMNAIITLLGC